MHRLDARRSRPGVSRHHSLCYYYSSYDPQDDHGAQPTVLIVFDDPLVEANFLGVAHREMGRTRVNISFWAYYREVLEKAGPLGPVWRNLDAIKPTFAFG